jgi:hypothetical protein
MTGYGIRDTVPLPKQEKIPPALPLNADETEALEQKQLTIGDTETFNRKHNDNFKNYIANHQIYREELEKLYNRIFNTEIGVPVKTYPVYLEGWHAEVKTDIRLLNHSTSFMHSPDHPHLEIRLLTAPLL